MGKGPLSLQPFPNSDLARDLERLERLSSGFAKGERDRINLARTLAEQAHDGQIRADGAPYACHLYRVAAYVLLSEETCGSSWIEAALLHDALEDTDLTACDIRRELGEETAGIVSQLTRQRDENETKEDRAVAKQEKARLLLNTPSPARTIKAWDISDNVLSMRHIPPDAKFFAKIPRWIAEVEDFQLGFCREVSPKAARMIEDEIRYLASLGHGRGSRVAF